MFPRSILLLPLIILTACATDMRQSGPIKVEIVNSEGGFRLLRGGEPYDIRGVGLEFGDIGSLAAHGGNTIRNWSTDGAQEVLDEALAHGVTVALGLPVLPERRGFDYSNEAAVARQKEAIRQEVLKYKNHPALLAWIIGNELNFDYSNSRVYDAVNDIARMIHEIDPYHPTTTTVAGLGRNVVEDLESRAPDLDILSFQVYGELFNIPEFVEEIDVDRPIWITEWGAIGHWETERTRWGAPLEMNSSEKADVYLRGDREVIRPQQGRIIGSFAFLWGQKQERTPTWFGMFTEDGRETEVVDVMHYIWTGAWPDNRSPQVNSMLLDGKPASQSVTVHPTQVYRAEVDARDPDGDMLSYHWELKLESHADQVGGDREAIIENIDIGLDNLDAAAIEFTAPVELGAYRLFVYVYDGERKTAHANIPFLVDGI